jgi:spore coat protein CotH
MLDFSPETEQELLVNYQIKDRESLPQALVKSFEKTDTSPHKRKQPLQEWVDVDSLSRTLASENVHYVSARIWDHPTYITANAIVIYSANN